MLNGHCHGGDAVTKLVTSLGFVVSGEKLLERYGMTETGMVVSNPLQGM